MRRTRRPYRGVDDFTLQMQLPSSLPRLASVADDLRSWRWLQSLPWLVSVALVLVLAWQVVQLGWKFLAPPTAAPAASVAAVAPEPAVDLQAIVGAHLFGVAGATPGSTDPNAVAATQMNLVLVGTIAESDPARGWAIIGTSAADAKVYAVGKTVSGGTKLHEVYTDRVILDRGGRLEALMLPRKFQGGSMAGNGRPPTAPLGAGGMPTLGSQLRDLAADGGATITQILRPQPVFADGHQRGYRVYPGPDRAQFAKLGLMPGDLVTAVNGTPLDDPARGVEILQTMDSATDVTISVERNGQPTQITINNAQVAAEAAAAAALPAAVPVTDVPEPPGQQEKSE